MSAANIEHLPDWRTLRVMWITQARVAQLMGTDEEVRSCVHLARDCNRGLLRDKRIERIERRAAEQLREMKYEREREPRHEPWEERYAREVGVRAYGPI